MQWGVDYQRKVSNKIFVSMTHMPTNYHIRQLGNHSLQSTTYLNLAFTQTSLG